MAELGYPKAKYKKALEGGDVKSPAYEKIVSEDGEAKRLVEFHPYVTALVNSSTEEEALGDGWYDTVAEAAAGTTAKPKLVKKEPAEEPAKKEK